MLFKFAITIVKGPRPYLLQVAIPDQGKFLVHEFQFSSASEATTLAHDYFWTFEKTPELILKFHRDTVTKREANLELPFFKG
jgi:hypothetical protein